MLVYLDCKLLERVEPVTSRNLDDSLLAVSPRLLASVAEQLKVPLQQIARQAELMSSQPQSTPSQSVQVIADGALQLIDSYLLGVQLAGGQSTVFEIEPVSISSVLYDVGEQLKPLAKQYGVYVELDIDGRYGPVLAHRRALQAALVSLGCALVEAIPAMETRQLRLELSAHRCRWGIVAGMYCETEQITAHALRQGRQLYGRARQPAAALTHSNGAGVFVADAILQAMQTRLMTSRHHKLHGLGAVLQPSPQLQLV